MLKHEWNKANEMDCKKNVNTEQNVKRKITALTIILSQFILSLQV